MKTADMVRAARDVVPPVGASRPMVTVEHTSGTRLPNGAPAGTGGLTRYRAAWLIDGRRFVAFGPSFDRPRDVGRFVDLLTGGGR